MALLAEKDYSFPGLISVSAGYRSFDLDQIATNAADILVGTVMEKSVTDDETSWIPWDGVATTTLLGLNMKEIPAGTLGVGAEDRRTVLLTRDAEYAFEKVVYQSPFVPNAAEIEATEDRMRAQGIVWRKNDHDLQNGTT